MIGMIINYAIISAIFLVSGVNLFHGINLFEYDRRITTKSVAMRIWMTRVLPVLMIVGSIWFSGRPILDYTIKDYQMRKVVVTYVSSPLRTYILKSDVGVVEEIDTYSLPIGYPIMPKEGKTYEFTYGKRSRIIIGIRELVP